MSQDPHVNYQVIFDNALEAYKRITGKDLASESDPLLRRLESCDSTDAILVVLRDQIPTLNQSETSDDSLRFTNWLNPVVNVLYTFSAIISGAVGLVSFCGFEINLPRPAFQLPFNIYFLGIFTRCGDLHGHWHPSLGGCLPRYFFCASLTVGTLRRLGT